MRIAVFSDIHGNLPALEAVWADLQNAQPDAVYCLGDLVNLGPWPNEVVEFIRGRRISSLMGNHDQGIGQGVPEFPFSYQTEEEHEAGLRAIAFTNATLRESNRQYLQTLPLQPTLTFNPAFGTQALVLTHGSPASINEYVFEDCPEPHLVQLMGQANAKVLLMGHTHRPYIRRFILDEGAARLTKLAVNVGSVGKPKDGDPRAAYALLTVLPLKEDLVSGLNVQIKRVPYNVQQVQQAIRASGLPDLYAQLLANA